MVEGVATRGEGGGMTGQAVKTGQNAKMRKCVNHKKLLRGKVTKPVKLQICLRWGGVLTNTISNFYLKIR